MRNISVVYKLAAVALLAFSVQSCKKRLNGIDNNQIISKPYSLFIADTSGQIEFTNDGTNFRVAFGPGGSEVRALMFADTNLIKVLSKDAFVAADKKLYGGDNYNFNPINLPAAINTPWQSMVLYVPSHKRVYMAGNVGMGVITSDSSGKRNTWLQDNNFATGITGAIVTSFTQLADGTLIGFDHFNNRVFHKTGVNTAWSEQLVSGLPTGGKFFISHLNNTLVAGDSTGTNGVWYSNNKGQTWQQYTGLPAGAQVLCMNAPYDRVLLIGTASHGLFRVPLNSSNMEPSSQGLNSKITVRGIASKDDFYKNNQVIEYVYLATDYGLYRSMDIGNNWILLRKGNYVAAY